MRNSKEKNAAYMRDYRAKKKETKEMTLLEKFKYCYPYIDTSSYTEDEPELSFFKKCIEHALEKKDWIIQKINMYTKIDDVDIIELIHNGNLRFAEDCHLQLIDIYKMKSSE